MYEQLTKDDQVYLFQFGCGADRLSNPETVQSVDSSALPSPQFAVTPLYHGDLTIELKNVLPGAYVSALFDGSQYDVNEGAWIPTIEATSDHASIPVFPWLLQGRNVVPFQEMCGNHSSLNSPSEVVTRPSLLVQPTPTTLMKGPSTTFVVNAVDPVQSITNGPNWGEVEFNGLIFGLGWTENFNFAPTDTRRSINGKIEERPWNAPATFNIPLQTPHSPQLPSEKLTLHLVGAPAGFFVNVPLSPQPAIIEAKIQSITWTVKPSWGAPSQSVSASPHTDSSGSTIWYGDASFPRAGIQVDPQQRLVAITGLASLSFPLVGDFQQPPHGAVPLTGSIEMADSGTTCIGWFLTFTLVPGDRQLHWTCCTDVGTSGPLHPYQYGGDCSVSSMQQSFSEGLLQKQEL